MAQSRFAPRKVAFGAILSLSHHHTKKGRPAFIIAIAFGVFLAINPHVPWESLLNAPSYEADDLTALAFTVFSLFCLRFLFQLVECLLLAEQKPEISSALLPTANLLTLVVLLVVPRPATGLLNYVGLVFTASPVLVLLVANIVLFATRYRAYLPSISCIDLRQLRSLFGLGAQFFVIQIAVVVVYGSTNLVIAHLLGPETVTVYNVAYRYFSLLLILVSVVMTPFWSASTEAYKKQDFAWIRHCLDVLVKSWVLVAALAIVMLAGSGTFYVLWVGDAVSIPFNVSAAMAILVTTLAWAQIYVSFINGIGKIRLQFYLALAEALVVVPLSIVLARYLSLGVAGVIVAVWLTQFIPTLIIRAQLNRILNRTAYGLWNQ